MKNIKLSQIKAFAKKSPVKNETSAEVKQETKQEVIQTIPPKVLPKPIQTPLNETLMLTDSFNEIVKKEGNKVKSVTVQQGHSGKLHKLDFLTLLKWQTTSYLENYETPLKKWYNEYSDKINTIISDIVIKEITDPNSSEWMVYKKIKEEEVYLKNTFSFFPNALFSNKPETHCADRLTNFCYLDIDFNELFVKQLPKVYMEEVYLVLINDPWIKQNCLTISHTISGGLSILIPFSNQVTQSLDGLMKSYEKGQSLDLLYKIQFNYFKTIVNDIIAKGYNKDNITILDESVKNINRRKYITYDNLAWINPIFIKDYNWVKDDKNEYNIVKIFNETLPKNIQLELDNLNSGNVSSLETAFDEISKIDQYTLNKKSLPNGQFELYSELLNLVEIDCKKMIYNLFKEDVLDPKSFANYNIWFKTAGFLNMKGLCFKLAKEFLDKHFPHFFRNAKDISDWNTIFDKDAHKRGLHNNLNFFRTHDGAIALSPIVWNEEVVLKTQWLSNTKLNLHNKKTWLQAPTGSGKTQFMLTTDFIGNRILACPKKSIVQNIEKSNKFGYKKPLFLYEGKNFNLFELASTSLIVCTWDQLAKIKANLKEISDLSKWTLVIDEAHEILQSANYREWCINEMGNMIEECKTIFISGTTIIDPNHPFYQNCHFIKCTLPKPNHQYVELAYSHFNKEQMFHEMMERIVPNKLNIININHKEWGIMLQNLLEKRGLKTYLFNSDTIDTELHQEILTKEEIDSSVEVLIVTSSFESGININNDYCATIQFMNCHTSFYTPESIVQSINRFRKGNIGEIFVHTQYLKSIVKDHYLINMVTSQPKTNCYKELAAKKVQLTKWLEDNIDVHPAEYIKDSFDLVISNFSTFEGVSINTKWLNTYDVDRIVSVNWCKDLVRYYKDYLHSYKWNYDFWLSSLDLYGITRKDYIIVEPLDEKVLQEMKTLNHLVSEQLYNNKIELIKLVKLSFTKGVIDNCWTASKETGGLKKLFQTIFVEGLRLGYSPDHIEQLIIDQKAFAPPKAQELILLMKSYANPNTYIKEELNLINLTNLTKKEIIQLYKTQVINSLTNSLNTLLNLTDQEIWQRLRKIVLIKRTNTNKTVDTWCYEKVYRLSNKMISIIGEYELTPINVMIF